MIAWQITSEQPARGSYTELFTDSACKAIDKSAEPRSLMLSIGTKRRKALLAQHPDLFYLTDHYAPYPAVLVRLPRIEQAMLKELLMDAREFLQQGVE